MYPPVAHPARCMGLCGCSKASAGKLQSSDESASTDRSVQFPAASNALVDGFCSSRLPSNLRHCGAAKGAGADGNLKMFTSGSSTSTPVTVSLSSLVPLISPCCRGEGIKCIERVLCMACRWSAHTRHKRPSKGRKLKLLQPPPAAFEGTI